MPSFCNVVCCSNNATRDDVKFYRFPMLRHNSKFYELSKIRQNAWIAALNRSEFKLESLKNARVCSKHFISGRSAHLTDINNPDWVPSLFLSVTSSSTGSVAMAKFKLMRKRDHTKLFPSEALKNTGTSETISIDPKTPQIQQSFEMKENLPNMRCICIYPDCNHTYPTTENETIFCTFVLFPNPKINLKEHRRWKRLCSIPYDFELANWTRVCTCHFEIELTEERNDLLLDTSKRKSDEDEEADLEFDKASPLNKCVVPLCYHHSRRNNCKLYVFPNSRSKRSVWRQKMRIHKDFTNPRNVRICSCHFSNGKKTNNSPIIFRTSIDKRRKCFKQNGEHESEYEALETNDNINKPSKNVHYVQEFQAQELETENNVVTVNDNFEPCSVYNCYSSKLDKTINYFIIPKIQTDMPQSYQLLESKRREAWLNSMIFKFPNADTNTFMICSEHFITGKPADILNYTHMDWVPSIRIKQTIDGVDMIEDPLFVLNEYTSFKENIGQWIFGDIHKAKNNVNESQKDINNPPLIKKQKIPNNIDKKNNGQFNVDTIIEIDDESDASQQIQPTIQDKTLSNYSVDTHQADQVPLNDSNLLRSMLLDKSSRQITVEKYLYSQIPKDRLNTMLVDRPSNYIFIENIKPIISYDNNRLPPIECKSCHSSFPNYVCYYNHITNSLKCANDKCEICEEKFTTEKPILLHIKNHSRERSFKCSICNTNGVVSTIAQMDHLRTHCENKYYICDFCGKLFLNSDYLRAHSEIHLTMSRNSVNKLVQHIGKSMTCDKCGKVFYLWKPFFNHMQTNSTIESPVQCEICLRWYKHPCQLQLHMDEHFTRITYECYICNKQYKQLKNMKKHLLNAHPINDCLQKNSHDPYLVSNDTHTIENPFLGVVNNKEYLNEDAVYMSKHVEERPKTSDSLQEIMPPVINQVWPDQYLHNNEIIDCNDQVNTSQINTFISDNTSSIAAPIEIIQIINHENTAEHSQTQILEISKQFACKLCYKTFETATLMKCHKTKEHSIQYRCKICKIIVTDLIKHKLTHKKCTICHRQFGSESELECHTIIAH